MTQNPIVIQLIGSKLDLIFGTQILGYIYQLVSFSDNLNEREIIFDLHRVKIIGQPVIYSLGDYELR